MKLTRADVERTIVCGDVICVTYRKTDGIARLLRFFEHGKASHAIECLGGLDIIEETIGGGMRTNLYTYLRGNCDLTIKRVPGGLTTREQARARTYWLSLVGKGYGWDSIKQAAISVPVRRFIKPRFPRLARWILTIARRLLPGKMPDCSAAWVEGIRLSHPHTLLDYDSDEVTPETLLRDGSLHTIARWKSPVLEEA